MSTFVHRAPEGAKSITVLADASPGQQALLDDFRAELLRLRALELRASRLFHVRMSGSPRAVLAHLEFTIRDAFFALDRVEAHGGHLEWRHGEGLVYVPPPARVIQIAPYLERRSGAG